MKDMTTDFPDGRLYIGSVWQTGQGAAITGSYSQDAREPDPLRDCAPDSGKMPSVST